MDGRIGLNSCWGLVQQQWQCVNLGVPLQAACSRRALDPNSVFRFLLDVIFKSLLPRNLQMASIVDELGPFEDAEALRQGRHPQNWVLGVLQRWTHVLEFDLFHKDMEADGDGRKSVVFPPCSCPPEFPFSQNPLWYPELAPQRDGIVFGTSVCKWQVPCA